MTGVTIYALMTLATASLLLGARLLDGSAVSAALGLLAILVGIGLAATAVAGAWRPRSRNAEGAQPSRPGSAAGPT